jgi:enoyl reductase-like protein
MKQPSRHLLGSKPLRYIPALDTDIRRTFRRARLLEHLRRSRDAATASLVSAAQAA